MIIDMSNTELQYQKLNDVIQSLTSKTITLQIPLPDINSARSSGDIITNFLDASYFLERISNNFKHNNFKKQWNIERYPVYHLDIIDFDKTELAKEILLNLWAFQYPENDDIHGAEFDDCRHNINLHESEITEKSMNFPDIVDDYHANLINGYYYELEMEIISNQLNYFPERWYGYWAAASYNNEEQKVLISRHCWIIPSSHTIHEVFHKLGFKEKPSLLNASLLAINSSSVIMTEGGAVTVPMERISQALSCAYESQRDRSRYEEIFDASINKCIFFVSEFFDFIVVKNEDFSIVSFDTKRMNNTEANNYIAASKQLSSSIEDNIFTNSKISIDWSKFDDEQFENLAYDLIYHNTKFDQSTVRKMGKSRSRDGGRDIVAYTKPSYESEPIKYIFQCKLINPNASLGTSRITSISDMLDQYGADGFGVICNSTIDATFFDRMDGIEKNRGKKMEHFSKLEIERFLGRRPAIYDRYISEQ